RAFYRERVAGAVYERVGDECGNRIHPEHKNRHRPGAAPLLDFQCPIKTSEKDQRETAAEQHERTGPEVLVNRKPETPNLSRSQAENSDPQHTDRFRSGTSFGAQPVTGQHSDQGGANRRNRAEDSLWIAGSVKQMTHEQFAVEPRDKVAIRIHEGDVVSRPSETGNWGETQQGPVADQACAHGNDRPAPA